MMNLRDMPAIPEDKFLYFAYAQCRHCGRYVSNPYFTPTMVCDCGHVEWSTDRFEEPNMKSRWVGNLNEHMLRIAHSFGVHVIRDTRNQSMNHGSVTKDLLSLGESISPSLEWLIFFHELGHCVSIKRLGLTRPHYFTKVSQEGLAWEVGLQIAYEHGFSWEAESPEMMHAKTCFHSYNNLKNWGLPESLDRFNCTPEEIFLYPSPLRKWVFPPSYRTQIHVDPGVVKPPLIPQHGSNLQGGQVS